MSADLLRRAATKARDTANAAPRGPWTTTDFDQSGDWWLLAGDGDAIARTRYWPGGIGDDTGTAEQTAAHIALWHPQVALAVANWLEQHAADELHEEMPPNERAASGQGCQWCIDEDWPCADRRAALAVAHALLNEEPNHG